MRTASNIFFFSKNWPWFDQISGKISVLQLIIALVLQTSSLTFAEKLPILKGEASHYDSDLHNLLFCCQCTDVAFYSEDFSKVMEAHKVILCSVSQVFMLLFNVKSPADVHDSSVVRTAQSLFAVDTGAGLPVPRGSAEPSPPARVIVKDSVFCSCLLDILHFIYSGTWLPISAVAHALLGSTCTKARAISRLSLARMRCATSLHLPGSEEQCLLERSSPHISIKK